MIRKQRSKRERDRLFIALSGKCHLCNGKIFANLGEAWDLEHVIPLAQGGQDDESNLALAHRKCHREKTITEAPVNAKIERIRLKHLGIRAQKRKWPSRKFGT